jgi:hypothetical protein
MHRVLAVAAQGINMINNRHQPLWVVSCRSKNCVLLSTGMKMNKYIMKWLLFMNQCVIKWTTKSSSPVIKNHLGLRQVIVLFLCSKERFRVNRKTHKRTQVSLCFSYELVSQDTNTHGVGNGNYR